MSSRTKPSYDIKTQPILTPGQNYDLEPDNTAPKSSYDLTRPTSGFPTDFVSQSNGGTFFNKIKYSSHFTYTDLDLVTKKFVTDSIANIDLSSIEDTILASLSVTPANELLTYNNTNGRFTLSILPEDTVNWDAAYSWGDHSLEGYLTPPADDGKLYGVTDGEWVEIINSGSGASELDELSDVTLGGITLANRHALMYSSASGVFVNRVLVEADISDLQNYLLDITAESIGDLIDVTLSTMTEDNILAFDSEGNLVETTVSDLETDPIFLAWDKSTGISITKSQVSDFVEGDYEVPLTFSDGLERAVDGFTVTNTDKGSDAVTIHLSSFTHGDIAHKNRTALDTVTGANTGDETGTTIKTKLGAANTSSAGYLTSKDWNTFNNKQPLITFSASFDVDDTTDPDNWEVDFNFSGLDPNGILNYQVDDGNSSTEILWTSNKIESVLGNYRSVYSIRLDSGSTVANRISALVEGTDYPTGWVLSDDDAALVITHNLDRVCVDVKVKSELISGNLVTLMGSVAYATLTDELDGTEFNSIRLDALATVNTDLYLYIII